ncbi:hypothetical protein [Variovorax gossypii]
MGTTEANIRSAARAPRKDSWLTRLCNWPRRGAASESAAGPDSAPAAEPTVEIAQCLADFDDGLRVVEKAWTGSALMSKVNPIRVERVLDAFVEGDTQAIAALVVEIVAPANAVSPVTTVTSVNNPMREQFVRGVMGAVFAAIVDVELSYDSKTLTAAALIARVRRWIADPDYRQAAGESTLNPNELELANDVLCDIARDIVQSHEGSAPAAAMTRLGIVGPVGSALQLVSVLERAGRAAWDGGGRPGAQPSQDPQGRPAGAA